MPSYILFVPQEILSGLCVKKGLCNAGMLPTLWQQRKSCAAWTGGGLDRRSNTLTLWVERRLEKTNLIANRCVLQTCRS